MREIPQPTQIQEREAGVAMCESQLVIPLLETGSENTAQQQPQQPQQPQQQRQFETEENGMVVEVVRDMVELDAGKEQHDDLLQLPTKQQQQQQPPAAPPPVWKSQLVTPLLETGSESTAQQQPQEQQQQFETKGQGMVVDGKFFVEFKTGEKGWLDGLVVKLNLEPYLSCSMGAAAAEPIDMWARAGIGTRWLVAMEDAGCGRHGHPGREPFPPFAQV